MNKVKHRYIFPNIMASMMKNIDMKTQLEASMMSMFLLLSGMILMAFYSFFYLTQGLVFKILLIFNLVAGFIFMSSSLVTAYQQYLSYMDITDLQSNINLNPLTGNNQGQNIPRKKNRVNQFLFFFGLLAIIIGAMILSIYPDFREKYWMQMAAVMAVAFLMVISVFFRKNKIKDPVNTMPEIKKSLKTNEEKKQDIKRLSDLLRYKIDEYKKLSKEETEKKPIKYDKYISPEEEEFYN